ncbi:MAG: class I SAM-dependent methyltransferase [Acidiferrobacterales bacterium]
MGKSTLQLDEKLYDYLLSVSSRETPVLKRLREETDKLAEAGMQISPDQGQFMALLLKLISATRVIEIGTFTGYSALVMAMALPEDGQIICCDKSEEWTSMARRYWKEASVERKIDLRLGDALDTLDALIKSGNENTFDFAFIDADKVNYPNYFERCLSLLRQGGLIAVDNVLWGGSVINPEKQDDDTIAIRAFNKQLKDDDRVDISLVPIGDGLTLAWKK